MRRVALVLLTAALISSPALAAKPAKTAVGNDVSYPQCGKPLPNGQAFGIVGVNGGKASTANPCFVEQLAWAKKSVGGTNQPKAQVYVNTGNPGDVYVTNPELVSYWPKTGINRFGECTGGNDAACAYEYGKYMAQKDVERVKQVDPSNSYFYWLDIETLNSWTTDTTKNRAVLEGMLDALRFGGAAKVGIYSTSLQFQQIAGDVPVGNPLTGLDNWIPGATTLDGAKANCLKSPLTAAGRVTMTQYVSGNFDYDVSCR